MMLLFNSAAGLLTHTHVHFYHTLYVYMCEPRAEHTCTHQGACRARRAKQRVEAWKDQRPGRYWGRPWMWKTASLWKTPEWIEWASCEGVERKQTRVSREKFTEFTLAGGSTFQQYVVMVDGVNFYERVNLCVYVYVRREDRFYMVFIYSWFWVFPLSPFEKLSLPSHILKTIFLSCSHFVISAGRSTSACRIWNLNLYFAYFGRGATAWNENVRMLMLSLARLSNLFI